MKSFFKMLKYLWPYRSRIGLGVLAAIGMSLLFTVSIGMLAPILQVITSREGLTGWINRSNAERRLDIRFHSPDVPTTGQADTQLPIVLSVGSKNPVGDSIKELTRISAVNGKHVTNLADLVAEVVAIPGQADITLTPQGPDGPLPPVTVHLKKTAGYQSLISRVVHLLPQGDDSDARLAALAWIMVILMGMTIARNLLRYFNDVLVQGSAVLAITHIQAETYRHMTRLPMENFSTTGINDTISRVTQDTNQIKIGMQTLFGKTIQEPLRAGFCLILAFLLQWEVALVALIAAPVTGYFIRVFGKKMHKAAKKALVSLARMLEVLEETMFGLRVVKAYTMEGYEQRRLFRVQRKFLREQLRMVRIDAAVSPLLEVLGFVGMIVAVLLAAKLVLSGSLDMRILLVQLGLLIAVGDSMRKLSNVNNRLQQADAASERILNILSAKPEEAGADLPKLGPLTDRIAFRDVDFVYPGTTAKVLRGVNVEARAGEIVAVVGPNGSGKTTLLSLLPRFYRPSGGQITWDGQDLQRINLRSLRRQIGLVTQDAVIFADTVANNIRYGNPRVTREQVVAAAKQAFADEFIVEMPQGYDTIIGEHGTTLSGGQRQRLALARAILRNPSVLILDEAMSQVDAESELKIQRVLDKFLVGRTAFVIAHRFSTVRQADKIVVLENGRLVGLGTHDELIVSCPLYRTLYQTQLQGDPLPASPSPQAAAQRLDTTP
ncbi:MAG: Vitamin B12 import ATP-binding protein BtuD [Phycisphaerae bacterium]|nr:Vitamin B12 import ATP-binding protein BtuD [Phycisphaerae bacterium]